MTGETIELNRLFVVGSHTVLERTLISEYLLCNGYQISDLRELSPEVAISLIREACQFAAIRLAEIEFGDKCLQKIRLPISLN
jgi:hypothetical protein